MNAGKMACAQMARYVWNERCSIAVSMSSAPEEDLLNEYFQEVLKENRFGTAFGDLLEKAFALGGGALKEWVEIPKDENGNYDYESLYALDLDFFNQQLQALLKGEEVELPRFNFNTGKREMSGNRLKLDDNMILILEGIHALNPELTPHIPNENKFKIYVSALTTILLDDHNYIPTTDNRLLRPLQHPDSYACRLHPHCSTAASAVNAGIFLP